MRALLLSVLVALSVGLEIPARSVWFDASCQQRIQMTAWAEVGVMTVDASLSLFNKPETDGQRLLDYIFHATDDTTQGFLDNSLEAISSGTASSKDTANVLFYCDQDARWEKATNSQVPGNEDRPVDSQAWFDEIDGFVYDPSKSGASARFNIPGCKPSHPSPAYGQTYCNTIGAGTDRCTITLCQRLTSNPFAAISELGDIDFSFGSRPKIDTFVLPSEAMLHELTHTLPNDNTLIGRWIDVQGPEGPYKWAGVSAMSATQAIANAESLAYLGLGARIQSKGFAIGKSGQIYHRGEVPEGEL